MLGKLCFPVSAICVSETWTVSDSEQDYCIPGYTFYGKSRRGKIGGGVGIYVSETIDCIVRSDLELKTMTRLRVFLLNLCQCILYLVVSIDPLIPMLMVLCALSMIFCHY